MFPSMRRAHKLLLAALIGAVLILAPAVDASTTQPTPRQIAAAVTAATRSKLLWATINRCGADGDHTLGIRGEMPALAFPAHLLMVVTASEWSPTAHRYVELGHSYKLGGDVFDSGSVVQNGISLRFSGTVTVIASIDFEWFRDGQRVGSATRRTTAGHGAKDADAGTPRGYSAAACTIS
jgi:hypothetical protein